MKIIGLVVAALLPLSATAFADGAKPADPSGLPRAIAEQAQSDPGVIADMVKKDTKTGAPGAADEIQALREAAGQTPNPPGRD